MMSDATLRFSLDDQRRFADMSGDRNPVHVDPVAARRIAAGEPIVHGVHLVLKALDAAASNLPLTGPVALRVRFLRPVLLDEAITLKRQPGRDRSVLLTTPGGDAAVDINVTRSAAGGPEIPPIPRARPRTSRTARVRTFGEIANAAGAIELPRRNALARAFPRVSRALGADAVAALAAISKLVGMECPGRDSLLSGFDLQISPSTSIQPLQWRVVRADARFGLVQLGVRGAGVHGIVDAFLRPQPAPPLEMRAVIGRVTAGEFCGQRALVIGGSRGLGAATALLIAAGGGSALVTFARGRAEALALRKDAATCSRTIEVASFDVTADSSERLGAICRRFQPTHVYYFATPRIFVKRQAPFDDRLFGKFAEHYVSGFARVCAAVRKASGSVQMFYPSTIAVDNPPPDLVEYAAAKSAGESVCRSFDSPADGFRVITARLPRIGTDQTAALIAAPALDPVDALLPVVRDLQRSQSGVVR